MNPDGTWDKLQHGYYRRPVLVTGADGFVGSHLVEALLDLEAEIHVLVRKPPQSWKNLAPLQEHLCPHQADVRNYGQVRSALEPLPNAKELIIFHLAAQAHVGDSWDIPEITLETNVLGTLNVLKAVRELRLSPHCFDYAGSSEEYGSFDAAQSEHYRRDENGSVRLDEASPLNPQSPYATSKVAGDFISRNFFAAYGIPVVVTRMFNNFGPRQNPRFITGTVITQALQQDLVEIGKPRARRDFTYIEDGVRGHLLAALLGQPGEVYVFGQGKNLAIGDWANLILKVGQEQGFWGARELVVRPDRFRPGRTDEADLLADSTKLRDLTGWQPRVGWEDGIVHTIQWYKENLCCQRSDVKC